MCEWSAPKGEGRVDMRGFVGGGTGGRPNT